MCNRLDDQLKSTSTIRRVVKCSGPLGDGLGYRRLASPRSVVAGDIPVELHELSMTSAPPILTIVAHTTIAIEALEQAKRDQPRDLHRALDELAQRVDVVEDRLLLEARSEQGWRGLLSYSRVEGNFGLQGRLNRALDLLISERHRAPFALLLPARQHSFLKRNPDRLAQLADSLQQGRVLPCVPLAHPLVLPYVLDDLEVVVVEDYELGTRSVTDQAVEVSVRGSFTLCERRSGDWHAAVSLPNADFTR